METPLPLLPYPPPPTTPHPTQTVWLGGAELQDFPCPAVPVHSWKSADFRREFALGEEGKGD